MRIGEQNTDEAVYVIAEIGNNHEGDFDLAKEMIVKAAEAGANAVKFQTIVPDQLVSAADEKRIAQLTKFQFSAEQFGQLSEHARAHEVDFLSTPFDLGCVEWLNDLVLAFKIASGDNDFYPLIDRVARTGKPMLISMGFGRAAQAEQLRDFVEGAWKKHGIESGQLGFMHCVVSYPTPIEQAGLSQIQHLKLDRVTPGYSDHTQGIRAAELAVAAGARVIEKHFTIDKNYSDFRDHALSADPVDLRELIAKIREVETMLGPHQAIMQACEEPNQDLVRRSISVQRDLEANEVIRAEDLCWVRPRGGLAPGEEAAVVGKRAKLAIPKGTPVSAKMLESSSDE